MELRVIRDKIYQRVLRRRLKNFNSFGSHIPILIAIGILTKPKRVLELGSGSSSTPVFLNKTCYPDLEKFISVENDLEWYNKLINEPGFKSSADLVFQKGKIADYVRDETNVSYDVILIDDSYETVDRVATIRAVFESEISNSAVVMIHDFETREYKEAARDWTNKFEFLSFTPNVVVLWKNSSAVNNVLLTSIYKKIESNKWRYSIYDFASWASIFSGTI